MLDSLFQHKDRNMKAQIKTEILDVTPALAMEYLRKNNHNRPISDVSVKRYAALMRGGKWDFNGEPIIIADTGTLVDGQHRLNALIDSGATIKMVVVKGVSESAFSTIDIGKKRTGGDALATFDPKYHKNGAILAAAVNTIIAFGEHGVWNDNSRARPSHDELIMYVKKLKGLERSIEFVQTLRGAKKMAPLSALAALHYLFSKKDMDEAERFFHKFNTGEKLEQGDPILLLRQRLVEMNNSGGVFRTREVVPVIVKAWELTRNGEKVTRIRVDKEYIPTII
jgi:hypothetical protein